jgi:hypothetical protein
MSSGKAHAIATIIAAGVSGPVLVMLAGRALPEAVAVSAGCFAGLLLTPDTSTSLSAGLDVDHSVHADVLVRRAGGCLVAGL